MGTGADIVMIAGLVIGHRRPRDGADPRRGASSLVPLDVTGVLAAPVLSIFDSSGNLVQSNQGWATGNATAALMASAGRLPAPRRECRLGARGHAARRAPTPAQVSGANGTTGVALLEVYEVGASATTARLVNLSTRGEVGTRGNIMIPGITIGAGQGERTLLIRAAGPALAALSVPGTLSDPTMSVVDSFVGKRRREQ